MDLKNLYENASPGRRVSALCGVAGLVLLAVGVVGSAQRVWAHMEFWGVPGMRYVVVTALGIVLIGAWVLGGWRPALVVGRGGEQ
ncbi:hypothetical protein [Streptomyces wuyuanensis]|uniref:hypothetical protein n=1 Tax=Streptomyces wuyuanensis TaxID=1196353 RepID=UPI003D73CABF